MKNKFAISRTTPQAMRRVLILASRLTDPGKRSMSPVTSGARLSRSDQKVLQRIYSGNLN
jgi:hypothetical protein